MERWPRNVRVFRRIGMVRGVWHWFLGAFRSFRSFRMEWLERGGNFWMERGWAIWI